MPVTFTPATGNALTVTPIPGTLTYGDGDDDRGGGTIPNARAGFARNGSCEVLVDTTAPTETQLIALRSGIGEGSTDITGDAESYDALVDVEISGDAVQTAKITWKGTSAPAA
jgi:hypothetical protein